MSKKIYSDEELIEIGKSKNLEIIDFGYEECNDGRKRKIANCICSLHRDKGVQRIKTDSIVNSKKPCGYCNHSKLKETFKDEIAIINPNIEILSDYKNWNTKIKCRCKNCGYEWDGHVSSLLYGSGCRNCFYDHELWDKRGRKSTEDFKNELYEIFPHYKVVGEYNGTHENIKLLCTKCDVEFETTPARLLREEAHCPSCSLEQKREKFSIGNDEFIKRVKEVNPYIIPLQEYINGKTDMEFYCEKHDYIFVKKPVTFTQKKSLGCPYCMHENGITGGRLPEDVYETLVTEKGYIFKDVIYENEKAMIKFICPKHKDRGEQISAWGNMSVGKECCGFCNGTKRTTEDFRKIIDEKFDNLEIIGVYTQATNSIKTKCLIHDYIWEPEASNLMSGFGCPLCGREKVEEARRLSEEEIRSRIDNDYKDDNIVFLRYPKTTSDYATCQCTICDNIWDIKASSIISAHNHTWCSKCNSSASEKLVSSILDNWDIEYIPQYKFDDCKDIFALPFDFYLYNNTTCIEFDGEQHYYPIPYGGVSEDDALKNFEKVVKHDNIKTDYCKNNNINLIRIPYWERENIEYYLFDELVKYNILEQV